MELLTSRTTKNPNRKFWLCKRCNNFQWAEDRKPSEEKIDFLVEEVRKLALEIECLSVKFKLLYDDELRRRQTPKYDYIKILVIVVICYLFKCYF